MQMRETIEELRHQMYSTMDDLDELSQKELQQRVARRADMNHVLQALLPEEDYYPELFNRQRINTVEPLP